MSNSIVRCSRSWRSASPIKTAQPAMALSWTRAAGSLTVSNAGRDSYREFQVTGVYQVRRHTVNASYVRSRAFGDLNDFNQFFGNNPVAVIQPNARGRLPFDAPNRFLIWGEIAAPKKITLIPVLDLHTGFPYSTENQLREYVGPRNVDRYPRFASLDLQVTKEIRVTGFRQEGQSRLWCIQLTQSVRPQGRAEQSGQLSLRRHFSTRCRGRSEESSFWASKEAKWNA